MTIKFPVVPLAAGVLARVITALSARAARLVRDIARASKNRADARVLANLDRHMLADIGITRADLRDAFSEPFWEDPTALLRTRADERRRNRPAVRGEEFRRPSANRSMRQAC